MYRQRPPVPFNGGAPPPMPGVPSSMWSAGYWQPNPHWNPHHTTTGWVPAQHWGSFRPPQASASSYAQQQQQSYNPYRKQIKPPSAEYLSKPLVANPLGLSNLDDSESEYKDIDDIVYGQDGSAPAGTPWVWTARALEPDKSRPPSRAPSPPSSSDESTDSDSPLASKQPLLSSQPLTRTAVSPPPRESFTTPMPLRPTFSPAIIRTPEHYRNNPSRSQNSTRTALARHSSMPSSLAPQPMERSLSGVSQYSDEPAPIVDPAILSPLVIAQTPVVSTRDRLESSHKSSQQQRSHSQGNPPPSSNDPFSAHTRSHSASSTSTPQSNPPSYHTSPASTPSTQPLGRHSSVPAVLSTIPENSQSHTHRGATYPQPSSSAYPSTGQTSSASAYAARRSSSHDTTPAQDTRRSSVDSSRSRHASPTRYSSGETPPSNYAYTGMKSPPANTSGPFPLEMDAATRAEVEATYAQHYQRLQRERESASSSSYQTPPNSASLPRSHPPSSYTSPTASSFASPASHPERSDSRVSFDTRVSVDYVPKDDDWVASRDYRTREERERDVREREREWDSREREREQRESREVRERDRESRDRDRESRRYPTLPIAGGASAYPTPPSGGSSPSTSSNPSRGPTPQQQQHAQHASTPHPSSHQQPHPSSSRSQSQHHTYTTPQAYMHVQHHSQSTHTTISHTQQPHPAAPYRPVDPAQAQQAYGGRHSTASTSASASAVARSGSGTTYGTGSGSGSSGGGQAVKGPEYYSNISTYALDR